MLRIEKISKIYASAGNDTKALDEVSISSLLLLDWFIIKRKPVTGRFMIDT